MGKQDNKQRVAKRRSKRRREEIKPGGTFSCFSLAGDNASLYHRSAFSAARKREISSVRQKGACLRCKLLKRACSGEDPCKLCVAVAKAAYGSRKLMWMDCVRPTFQAVNIFGVRTIIDQGRVDAVMADLLGDDVYLDFHIPFALNVEAASTHLASWLSDDGGPSTFSVVGIYSCSTNTNLLQNALDPSLGRDLPLFVHLTTHLFTTGVRGGYQKYTDLEILSVRNWVGRRLLLSLDSLLRPSELEAPGDKLGRLKALFLLLLGTTVGMKYTVVDNLTSHENAPETKPESLLRLLCHYLIYIGKVASLLESSSDESVLVKKWKNDWNKPAAFTWTSSHGLEMHYRIEPPGDALVPSSEDESMSSMDIDLLDLDNDFMSDSELPRCSACGTHWAILDASGYCPNCQFSIDDQWLDQTRFPDVPVVVDEQSHPWLLDTKLGASQNFASTVLATSFHELDGLSATSSPTPDYWQESLSQPFGLHAASPVQRPQSNSFTPDGGDPYPRITSPESYERCVAASPMREQSNEFVTFDSCNLSHSSRKDHIGSLLTLR
ncbi:hypothetical protein BDV96DRAFT_644191 [Lophiotrema nucula]|uniref:Uncharacterized protein n=1 Tax=Lophiotrema nucula TaxID=690887 RepID=A0A6A5ZFH1_9PLEO|nr:hypothetical protein BDV96DRAFT_644191 [Lophiotrema nucula]